MGYFKGNPQVEVNSFQNEAFNNNETQLRNSQLGNIGHFRQLTSTEVDLLVKNRNSSDNWSTVLVTDKFDTNRVRSCEFFGLVRIGDLEDGFLAHNDLKLPVGLYRSKIISCDIGNNVCIENTNYISHYQVGDECVLFNINEMSCSPQTKFGNGIVKDGEEESVRIWLDLCNENGGRGVLPFDGMLAGDAFLWAKYRGNKLLMEKLKSITQNKHDTGRGYYGTIGKNSTIKHCRIIKDVKVGESSYIKGANKLKNLTINSSSLEPTQIGEGVEMVNGIVGFGCRVFYGVKAVRFILSNHATLKYGARLINSFLGENSTISCCEVLNALIFPGHEQHHNNSFLCAAMLMGQSNVAAAATIGSNHNSRANDGEIVAGRGFWPGLAVSLKHNSKFASFTLISKGSYPNELDIQIPFSLVLNDESSNQLKVIPGFWFMYNMYALARNSWKYKARDKRNNKVQNLEFDYLAPDTIDEVVKALRLMEKWTGESVSVDNCTDSTELGREVLNAKHQQDNIKVFANGLECSKRQVEILKPFEGYETLINLIYVYSAKVLVKYCTENGFFSWGEIEKKLSENETPSWVNFGGQLIKSSDVKKLKNSICAGDINSWEEVHLEYERLGNLYHFHKAQHAFNTLKNFLIERNVQLDKHSFISCLNKGVEFNDLLVKKTFDSRKKDYINPFRKMVYDNEEEMEAVLGNIDDNLFVKETNADSKEFRESVFELIKKLDYS